MSTKIKKKDNKEKRGFTLIELLAVIVVLGVVASITIVIFTGTKDSSKKQISEVSNKNILSSARDYAIEYLRDDSVWVPKTPTSDLYCVTVKNLIDKGFLKDTNKDLKDDVVIVVTKEKGSNNITTGFKQEDKECNGMLPSIEISVSGKKKEDSDSYYDRVDFTVNLPDKDTLDIKIDTFKWVVKDASGNETGMNCDVNGNSCSGSIEGKYGNITIEATVGNEGRTNTESKVVNIVKFEPEIVLTATGTKGNGDWYISDVGVEAKVVNGDSSLYNAPVMCISSNGSECGNTSGSSKVTLREVNSGKMVCANVKTKAGNMSRKCSSYLIDTSVPSVNISGGYNTGNGKVDVYGTISDGGSGVDSYSVQGYGSSTDYCKDSYKGSFSNTDGSRKLLKSYAANGESAVWVKDKAGNCGKVGYAVGMNKTRSEIESESRPLSKTVSTSYKIKDLVYADGILDSGSANTSNSNQSITFNYYNPNVVSSRKETSYDYYSAGGRWANESQGSCKRYDASSCTRNGTQGKLGSNGWCVGKYGNSYNGQKYCSMPFQCSCNGKTCHWSYARENCSYSLVYTDGSCYKGYYTSWNTNNNPGQPSCSKSEIGNWKTFSYSYDSICKWNGDFKADCDEYNVNYSCPSGYKLDGAFCYKCDSGETLMWRHNEYQCKYRTSTTVYTYGYGKYAYIYTIK